MVICKRTCLKFNDIIEYQRRVDHAKRCAIASIADGAGGGDGMAMACAAGIDIGSAGAMAIAAGAPVKAVVTVCAGAGAKAAIATAAEVFGKVSVLVGVRMCIGAGGGRSAGKAVVVAGQVGGAECHRLAATSGTECIIGTQAAGRGEAVGGCAPHIVEAKDGTAAQVGQVEGSAAIAGTIIGANSGKQGRMCATADRIAGTQHPAIGSGSAGECHDGAAGYTAGATGSEVGPGTAGIIIKTAGTISLVYEQAGCGAADAGTLRLGEAGHKRTFIGTGYIELSAGMRRVGANAYLGLCGDSCKKENCGKKVFHIGDFNT